MGTMGSKQGNMPITQNVSEDSFAVEPCFSPIQDESDHAGLQIVPSKGHPEVNEASLSQDERSSLSKYLQDLRRCSSPGLRSKPSSLSTSLSNGTTYTKTSLCQASSGYYSWPNIHDSAIDGQRMDAPPGSGYKESMSRVGLRSSFRQSKAASDDDIARFDQKKLLSADDSMSCNDLPKTSSSTAEDYSSEWSHPIRSGFHEASAYSDNTVSRSEPINKQPQSQCSVEECQHKCSFAGLLKIPPPDGRGDLQRAKSCNGCIEMCDASTSPLPMPVCPWKQLQQSLRQVCIFFDNKMIFCRYWLWWYQIIFQWKQL